MEKIPSSFMGYKKDIVKEIIEQKDILLDAQQKDIEYLRNEITKLEKNIQKYEQNN